jgi:hypothetical protein
VDQLLRWSKFFPKRNARAKERGPLRVPCRTPEAHPYLPRPAQRKPEAWERGKERRYEEMDLAIKRRLEEYFEPHNGRLYDFLGADLGW